MIDSYELKKRDRYLEKRWTLLPPLRMKKVYPGYGVYAKRRCSKKRTRTLAENP